MSNTQIMTTEFHQPQRPVMSANRRFDPTRGEHKPFKAQPFQKQNQQCGKKPGQRNLEPNERMLAVAKREGRHIEIALASVDSQVIGKVTDFGKYEIIVEQPTGELVCVFKSDISTFIIKRQVQ